MKLLVTGAWNCTDEQINILKGKGYEILFMQNEADELPSGATESEGVICNGLFLHHDIRKFEKLRYIQLTSAGFDRVPLEEIEKRGIKIFNARGVYSVPMAEFAIAGVLQLYKQSRFFLENQKNKKWEKHRNLLELSGKKVCILGCGSVGTECAKRFKAFGCSVFGVDAYPYESEFYEEMVSLFCLDEKLKNADVVILTLPLTKETENLFDEKKLGTMKSGAVLVNIARGKIVSEKALLNALEGKLLGAVLDVFEQEPLSPDSPLWEMENVILTPHNSFVGDGNKERIWKVIDGNLSETKND